MMTLSDFGPICGEEIPHFLVFDFSTAPALLFYAYIPITLVSLALSILILKRDNSSLRSRLLLALSAAFALWIINILVQWVASYHTILLFGWQLTAMLEVAFYVLCLYFFLVFVEEKDVPWFVKWILGFPFILVAFLTPTTLNIAQYDAYNCEGVVGLLWGFIYYGLEPVIIGAIALYGALRTFQIKTVARRQQVLLTTIGLSAFLFVFWLSNVAAELTKTYEINLIGPLGMVIFLLLLGYQIVQYKIYNLNVIGTQAFVVILWVLVGSLLLVAHSDATRLVAGFTLLAAVVIGFILIRSVRRTVRQKEEIEKLAQKLEKANERLKVLDKMKSEFVSIASHQLRSPLTSIRGYTSMLLEGSYGNLPQKARSAVERISESSRFMATSVEDYLNVSRIQAGNMKYEYSDFNLKNLAQQVADDTRQLAMKKGLLLTFKSDLSKKGIVHADIGKTRQVIDNLVNNALKYTQRGTIRISVYDDPKKKLIYVDISDTGIGMSPQTIDDMFEKFERAHNANAVNVTGTGLGLYIARKIAQEMGGDVTAMSEGEGKGSTFTLHLPLQM